jgi:hypothetical protein
MKDQEKVSNKDETFSKEIKILKKKNQMEMLKI